MSEVHPMPKHQKFVNLTGMRFGRLTVEAYGGESAGRKTWICKCDCGNDHKADGKELKKGSTKSCGCLRRERAKGLNLTHGMGTDGNNRRPEYEAWSQMLQRCTNPKSQSYPGYGARGISVCDSWRSFENFYRDMGPRPSNEYSLDRIDNDGNYEPGNCRWANRKEQCRNKRNNVRLAFRGETLCLAEWSERLGIKIGVLQDRLRLGWSAERTLTTPFKPRIKHASLHSSGDCV